jgi:hypothetical protein
MLRRNISGAAAKCQPSGEAGSSHGTADHPSTAVPEARRVSRRRRPGRHRTDRHHDRRSTTRLRRVHAVAR